MCLWSKFSRLMVAVISGHGGKISGLGLLSEVIVYSGDMFEYTRLE